MIDDVKQFYARVPPVTKVFVTFPTIVLLLNGFRIMEPHVFYYSFEQIKSRYQIWRFLTGFVTPYFGDNVTALFDIYSFYHYSSSLESGAFANNTYRYSYFFFIACSFMLLMSPLTHAFAFFSATVSALMLLFSVVQPEAIVSIFFFKFRAKFLPIGHLILTLFTVGPFFFYVELSGFFGGYLYICFANKDFGPILPELKPYLISKGWLKSSKANKPKVAGIKTSKEVLGSIEPPAWFKKCIDALAALSNLLSGYLSSQNSRGSGHRLEEKRPWGSVRPAPSTDSARTTGFGTRFPGKGRKLGM